MGLIHLPKAPTVADYCVDTERDTSFEACQERFPQDRHDRATLGHGARLIVEWFRGDEVAHDWAVKGCCAPSNGIDACSRGDDICQQDETKGWM